ncbi:isoprenylcysteine carboxylmethyltransferase family protein [Shinella sp. CPCC 101442]|uniref:methyltransferase family protein n=1 Tax=Shinella sp. CPCC 101442 TaxID=2932265 RepID=UPI00215332C1|nr:isoprenylcysteine carboxylmethyltransferase family protein [Shinella sp. CPCC 101442]MCR6499506.1 isoprenylcysteine carboxylmethyltransferase family protein [Shinella sp. CPCC 101442]
MPLLSAAIMGFYLAAFLVLTARSARAAGRPVWLSALDQRQGLPAILFRASFAGGLLYPLMLAAGIEPFREAFPVASEVRVAGLAIAFSGALFAIHAQHYMGASWRIGSVEGHSGAIVDTGPFGLSRNPVFVGQVVLFVGFILARPDVVQVALAASVVLAVWLQVRTEERVLVHDLGAPYEDYRRRVRRWL